MSSLESPLERLAALDRAERDLLIEEEARKSGLSPDKLRALLLRTWVFVGRPKQQPPPGDWMFWFLNCGRGFGKAACVETPVPTPDGWKRLGDIEAGDEVFDESGRRSRVDATFDRMPEVAYRLWFSDGTHVDVCSEHLWTTWRHRDRKALGRSSDGGSWLPLEWPEWRSSSGGAGPSVRTTQEIVETLTHGKRGDLNHSIPVCGPLDLPERNLPLDPYVLGAWLGDGSKYGGQIHADPSDHEHWYRELAAFSPHRVKAPLSVATHGLHVVLRTMGLLQRKHVPAEYLRASPAQRLALLQGLMDTDGSAVPSSVEFSNTNYLLVRAVVELARSLGQKPVVAEGRAMLDGRDCGPKWRVTWRPTIPVFRMERKGRLVKPLGSQAIRNQHRMIVHAEPIDPKPMRCLTVASRHRTFLLGEGMIPTHNTISAAQFVKEKGLERRSRVGVIAPTLGDARSTCFEGETGLLSVLPNEALLGQSRSSAWNKSLLELTLANGTIYKGFSSEEPDRLRGPQHDYVWGEEVSSWKDAKHGDAKDSTFSNMKLGLRLGENPQAVLTSTPKPNKLTKELVALARTGVLVEVKGSSYENRANLSEAWWRAVVEPLEGTRTGRQEIMAELLEDVEGALWTKAAIDLSRVTMPPPRLLADGRVRRWQDDEGLRQEWMGRMSRIAVGLDPNTTSGEAADAAGIVVVGLGFSDRHGYVLDDRTQTRGGPKAWAAAAVDAYHDWGADRVVGEGNNGGEMIAMVIQGFDPAVPVEIVSASRGKRTRAEPISALYEADVEHEKEATMHHVGAFVELEDEMTTWTPEDESPNRMDALVWAAWYLRVWKPPQAGSGSHVARGDIAGIVGMGAGLPDDY